MADRQSSTPLRAVVVGVAGRMGRTLASIIEETDGVTLVGATESSGHDWVGRDLAAVLGVGSGVTVSDEPGAVCVGAEAILDFTAPAASVAHAGIAAEEGLVHVIGTTGFADDHLTGIAAAARRTAIVRSGNMSLGVNLLAGLARQVSGALGAEWDAEILEVHHNRKVDAPSGTALLLGEAVAAGRGVALQDCAERGRDGHTGARTPGAIGFAALRAGDVVGEHDVIFAGIGERVVLRHVATDRAIFARGALHAARWARGKPPGEYSMADVLGLGDARD